MRAALQIAAQDLRLFLRDRANLPGLLIIPSVLTLVIGFVNSGGGGSPGPLRVDVVDLDQSSVSAAYRVALVEANSSLVLCPHPDDTDDECALEGIPLGEGLASARLREGTSLATIVIPAGLEETLQRGGQASLAYRSRADFEASAYVQQAAIAAAQRVGGPAASAALAAQAVESFTGRAADGAARAGLYSRAEAFWRSPPIQVTVESTDPQDLAQERRQNGLGQSVPGMGAMFVMLTVFGGMSALVVERKQGTLQRLATMPVRRGEIVGGKVLARFGLGLLQYLVVLVVGLMAGLRLGGDLLGLLVIALAFTLAVTTLSFAVGSRLENESQSFGLSLLLTLILAPLGGAWWPLEIVPPFMRTLGHVSPVAWAMDGYRQLIFENGTLGGVLLPVIVLFLYAGAGYLLGVRRIRLD
jgi:ABC-2 type transport system permease protein